MKICFRQTIYNHTTISEKESQMNNILADLDKTRRALEDAYAGFDSVTDPDLIDCYSRGPECRRAAGACI